MWRTYSCSPTSCSPRPSHTGESKGPRDSSKFDEIGCINAYNIILDKFNTQDLTL